MEQEERERAAFELEMESKARACNYLTTFLHSSPWTDQLDQITIVWDSVPTMEELESYGLLEEKEGTRNCRRLFKAVVVWDQLGHLLWQTLKDTAQQQQHQPTTFGSLVTSAAEAPSTDGAETWWHAPPENSFRRGSRRGSQDTSHSSLGSRGSANTNPFSTFERDYSTFSSLSSSPCEPSYMGYANNSRKRSDSLSAMLPRAIKKTFGVFAEK